MKFDVTNRWSGSIIFTAEIQCEEGASYGVRLGFAVKWGITNTANLCNANLCNADLRGADLRGADLRGADLRGADLCGANLCGADLCGADLCGADLRGADLCNADLCGADLRGADLRGANLCGADLCGANLCNADLCNADLCNAKNAPVIINYLPWTTYVYKDYAIIGCQEISRYGIETWGNDVTREQYKQYFPFKQVLIAVWEYAFPIGNYCGGMTSATEQD
jgi:uncharacterized protein YjbI with pentapeptide repeats